MKVIYFTFNSIQFHISSFYFIKLGAINPVLVKLTISYLYTIVSMMMFVLFYLLYGQVNELESPPSIK